MTRHLFGPELLLGAGSGTPPAALLAAGSAFTCWSAYNGGIQYTDLTAPDGVTPLEVDGSGNPVADENGQAPWLRGPDTTGGVEVVVMYRETGAGVRYPMIASDAAALALANGALLGVSQNWTAAQNFAAGLTVPDGALTIADVAGLQTALDEGGTGGGGTSDHGALSGLTDDDHPQYHTDARGDGRYYLKAQADSALASGLASNATADRNRANHTGTQGISTVTGLQTALDAPISTSKQLPGTPIVLVWDDATSQWKDVAGVVVGARPRTDLPLFFVGGDSTDVPSWGQLGADIHFVDGVVTLTGGGSVDLTNYYTKAESDARYSVSVTRRHLSTYAGATMSDKLRTCIATYPTSGSRPMIGIDPGTTLDAGTTPFEIPAGFHMEGTEAVETEFGYSCPINVRHTGASGAAAGVFCTAPLGSNDNGHKGWYLQGMTFLGTASTKFMRDNPFDASRYIAYGGFWNCHWNGFLQIYWGPAKGLAINGPGPTYMNNMAGVPWYLTGSDNVTLWPNGGFFEMGGVAAYSTRATLAAMIRCGSLAKTSIGPLYMTGSPTTPFRLDGGDGGIELQGITLEGRPNHAGGTLDCAGELMRLTGGNLVARAKWYGYAMRNPNATGRQPAGFIHISGGNHSITGGTFQPYVASEHPTYTRPDGRVVPAGRTPPFIYISGGSVSVSGITRGPNAGAVKPIVLTTNLAFVDRDGTVDLRLVGDNTPGSPTIDPAN